jgi:hypothetical protein
MTFSNNNGNLNMKALLIGVDKYTYPIPSLAGCVNDISHVEQFLLNNLKIDTNNIIKLVTLENNKEKSDYKLSPTRKNIINAFNNITENAKSGQQVYIHYAGHGSRVDTIDPHWKKIKDKDEVLVPTNVDDPEFNYIRDIEMVYLLKKMIDKGLVVTAVFDCCHSGGVTRGDIDTRVRGVDDINGNLVKDKKSLVAPYEELYNNWKEIVYNNKNNSETPTRNTQNIQMSPLKGCVSIAACTSIQKAHETKINGEQRGVLTHWFLDTLLNSNDSHEFTYQTLYNRLISIVDGNFENQTPMIEGDVNRIVFGLNHLNIDFTVIVAGIDQKEDWQKNKENSKQIITLNAGLSQGITKNAEFVVYELGTNNFKDEQKKIALVRVIKEESIKSKTEIIHRYRKERDIEEGAPAILVNLGSDMIGTVNLIYPPDSNVENTNHNQECNNDVKWQRQRESLDKLKEFIRENGKGWIILVQKKDNKNTADENSESESIINVNYHIAIDQTKESNEEFYNILDNSGQPISNLDPKIRIYEQDSEKKITERLIHIVKFKNVEKLIEKGSSITGKLCVELFGLPDDYESDGRPVDEMQLEELKKDHTNNNAYKVKNDQKVCLKITNNSNYVLNISILDLQPDWGISQLRMDGANNQFIPLEPGKTHNEPIKMSLPGTYEVPKDILKVFATIGPTDYRWLRLPALDQQLDRGFRTRHPKNPLEELMEKMSQDVTKTRHATTMTAVDQKWTTEQIKIEIEK